MVSSDVVMLKKELSRSKEEGGFLVWWRNNLLPDWRDTALDWH
jgi:hypothetical protein